MKIYLLQKKPSKKNKELILAAKTKHLINQTACKYFKVTSTLIFYKIDLYLAM